MRDKRVLIVVRGGVADFIADDGVDVVIYDFDGEDENCPLPNYFSDLAEVVGAKYEEADHA